MRGREMKKTYGRSLDHGDGFDDFFLVHLGARAVEISNNGRHAGFVTHCGGKVDWLFGIVLGEGFNLAYR